MGFRGRAIQFPAQVAIRDVIRGIAAIGIVAVLTMDGGGGVGSSYPYLVLTNSGSADCSVTGYPGVSLAAGGTQIGAAACLRCCARESCGSYPTVAESS